MTTQSGPKKPPSKHDQNLYIPKIEGLSCNELIGSGHFSHVFKGSYKGRSPVSIKIIDLGNNYEILKEIYILKAIKGSPHTVNIIDALKINKKTNEIIKHHQEGQIENHNEFDCLHNFRLKNEVSDNDEDYDYEEDYDETDGSHHQKEKLVTVIITDFVEAVPLKHFFQNQKLRYFRGILRDVLESLQVVHSRKIIHRDITSNNILITPDLKHSFLIDWGCGAVLEQHQSLRPNAGSRQFRSPEMLMGSGSYGTPSDMWGVGVYIWSILCNNEVPWKEKTPQEVLLNISEYFGSEEIIQLSKKLRISLKRVFGPDFIDNLAAEPVRTFEECFSQKMNRLFSKRLISLMKSLLRIDPEHRLTPEQALQHPFFQ